MESVSYLSGSSAFFVGLPRLALVITSKASVGYMASYDNGFMSWLASNDFIAPRDLPVSCMSSVTVYPVAGIF